MYASLIFLPIWCWLPSLPLYTYDWNWMNPPINQSGETEMLGSQIFWDLQRGGGGGGWGHLHQPSLCHCHLANSLEMWMKKNFFPLIIEILFLQDLAKAIGYSLCLLNILITTNSDGWFKLLHKSLPQEFQTNCVHNMSCSVQRFYFPRSVRVDCFEDGGTPQVTMATIVLTFLSTS